ncbi:hypothetical protein ABZ371_08530 [Streptomyces sp. NPDC005899]|uniref:hypothetical protein n=1 Tax=Streptomyces sp. NPDC005899 TaxID=3155716 RepID=UPI0033C25D0F
MSLVLAHFVAAGWSSRPSSREGHELETGRCRLEIDPTDEGVLLNGVIDPQRLGELGALLARLTPRFGLEPHDDDGTLVEQVDGRTPGPAAAFEAAATAEPAVAKGPRRGSRNAHRRSR